MAAMDQLQKNGSVSADKATREKIGEGFQGGDRGARVSAGPRLLLNGLGFGPGAGHSSHVGPHNIWFYVYLCTDVWQFSNKRPVTPEQATK